MMTANTIINIIKNKMLASLYLFLFLEYAFVNLLSSTTMDLGLYFTNLGYNSWANSLLSGKTKGDIVQFFSDANVS